MYNFSKIYKFNKKLFQQLAINEAKDSTEPEAKDIKRINDMLSKAPDNIAILRGFAEKMVKSIKDSDKMLRRYKAAVEILGKGHPITQVFADGCQSMNIDINDKATDDNKNISVADTISNDMQKIDISPDELLQALDKQKIEKETDELKNNLNPIDFEDEIDQMPFEYIQRLTKVKLYFNLKLSQLHIIPFLDLQIKEIISKQSRYKVEYCDITDFHLHLGKVYISAKVQFLDQVHEYGRKSEAYMSWILINNAAYSILNNDWDIDSQFHLFKWDDPDNYYSYLRLPKIHKTEAPVKAASFLKMLGTALSKSIKKNKAIDNLIQLYNNTAYRIYKDANDKFGDNDIVYNNYKENQKFSPINQLRERITNMICDKFDVDSEKSDNWPGFNILKITAGTIIITPAVIKIKDRLTGLMSKDYIRRNNINLTTLYNFFKNTVGIDKDYIFVQKSTMVKNNGFIEIDIKHLADALK